ncbi:MAG TPA: histidine kinase [Candidatus Dormibacteraeota bacterium]|nr:histidine kinase [Candidatus Dormibacteraeota bacterium]
MTTMQRRVIDAGALAIIVLACFFEVKFQALGGRIVPALSGPWYQVLIDIVPGSSFVVAGIVAWSRRPRNRVGLLMIGIGIGLLTRNVELQRRVGEVAYPVELALHFLSPLWAVAFLQLLLAFPGGRLASRLDRAVVRSFYALVPLAAVLAVVIFHYSTLGAIGQPVFETRGPADYVYLPCLLIGSALVIRRWFLGGRARRRSISPLFLPMVPITIFFLVSLAYFVVVRITPIPLSGLRAVLDDLATAFPLLLVALPAGVLVGLLRSELDMSSVGDLVVKLAGGLAPERLQPALAQALHDPSLEVAYWLPAQEWFADLEGRRIELSTDDSERAVSILGDPSSPIAALVYDASLVHEGQLVDAAAAALRMALENARLQVQLRAQLEEVRESRARLVEAADNERQRVERDLHDGAQQQLVTLLLSMQMTKTEAMRRSDPETAVMIEANIVALKQALEELRELGRGIHPTILTQAGLVPAIMSLGERSPIPVEVRGELGEVRLEPPLEAALYFVVSEAMTNAVKHSRARRMCVSLDRPPGIAVVEISDDGVGGAVLSMGSGLRGLIDRVAAVGGRLTVKSDREGGTTIHAEVPCE